jgi:lipopolysaccharide/colanic/teichoic acid biosynthesis glycosyltransferase
MNPAGNHFQRDNELMEKLFRKYARGGVRISAWRQRFNFLGKKAIWVMVIEGSLAFKRVLDIVGSALGLVLFSPIIPLTALLIKLEDGGPVFYVDERVGKWGKIFRMYKFRSMVLGADGMKDDLMDQNEAGEVMFKIKRDPRITKVGRIIRKLSIDELPQFYNVLKGDMSLVGPRPALPRDAANYSLADRRRLDVIPGITCLWQVKGRSDIDCKGQIVLDVQYLESQSIWGDVVLLLKTIPAVLLGRGAY